MSNSALASSWVFSISFTTFFNGLTISSLSLYFSAISAASLASLRAFSCFSKTAAFSSETFLASSYCFSTLSNWSSNWSALSWSFSDCGRAASAFSASSSWDFSSGLVVERSSFCPFVGSSNFL